MNNDNWKTAISSRDRKRSNKIGRSDDMSKSEICDSVASPHVVSSDPSGTEHANILAGPSIPVAMPANDSRPAVSWAEASESPDHTRIITAFMTEVGSKYLNFSDRITVVATFVSTILDIGIKMIQDERNRIDASSNEKEFVRDLCGICTHGKKLIDNTIATVQTLKKHMATYESEKTSALDGLKTFLASIDQTMVPVTEPTPGAPGRYAGIVGTRESTAMRKPTGGQQLMASVPLGPGQMILPMTRDRGDIMPMSIKYASDLGVFLINIDNKLYSFCNGVFISRQSKIGDNTLYGKRCNPTSTRCVGANCTYYHDPLTHATGHTMRNMGVHYVISELINGIANDAEIAETARGKNKYIVEDIVSLAGMLLIKAFQIKKLRDHHGDANY